MAGGYVPLSEPSDILPIVMLVPAAVGRGGKVC